jgi:uncharacterized membrane protein
MNETASIVENAAGSGRSVSAGRGVEWWSEAWALFVKAAGMWIVLAILMIIIFTVVGIIPILGGLVMAVAFPVFMASWVLTARKVEQGGTIELGDLFTAFRGDKMQPLLIIGALLLVFGVAIVAVAGLLGLGAIFGVAAGGADRSLGAALAALSAGLLAFIAVTVISFVAGMALWFAPSLVVFRGTAPVDAMKVSFGACLRNIVPFVLYSLIYIVAAIVASIPFGLGWIVLAPLVMITLYVSYRDVFGA